MIVYPAMDLRAGQVVRLRYGDPAQLTTFSDDPVAIAQRWRAAGARWLHIVNLDGALRDRDAQQNERILRKIAQQDLHLQYAGGLRELVDIERILSAGATRVVIGTAAIERPTLVTEAIARWGEEAIAVALDSRGGYIATHGWQEQSSWTTLGAGRHFAALGLRHALFTDISRDGAMSGVNVVATEELARATGLRVIASGGVRSADDIQALRATDSIAGVIVGMALYAGQLTLPEALRAAREVGSC